MARCNLRSGAGFAGADLQGLLELGVLVAYESTLPNDLELLLRDLCRRGIGVHILLNAGRQALAQRSAVLSPQWARSLREALEILVVHGAS